MPATDKPLIDIRPDHWRMVRDILRKRVPQYEVWAFGSRAKWKAKEYSDLDLAVITDRPMSLSVTASLSDDFSESELPYKVDVVDWATTNESFRRIIERDKVVVQAAGGRSGLGVTGEWQRHEVSDLLSDGKLVIGDGYRAKNEELSSSGLPFARAGNINNGFRFEDADHFPEQDLARVGNKISQPGDVVFTSKGTVGRFAFVQPDTPRFVYSPQLCFWRSLDHKRIDPRYLYYWMYGREFFVQFKGVAGQTDMAEYVSLTDQRRMHISLPGIDEQRAIAHILGTLDDKIELNRRMNETLESMVRALFKSWFVDFDPVRAKAERRDPGLPKPLADLFPDSFEDSELGEIPKGWKIKSIGDLADVVGGTTPSTKEQSYWEGGTHAWATPKDLSALSVPVLVDTERRITDAGLLQIGSGLLPKGTVLLSSRAPIGYLAIAEIPVAINQGFIAMTPKTGTSTIFLLLWASVAHEEIVSRANGSTFLEISKANFRPIPVVTPSTDVMHKFDELARPLYERIVECARESRTIAALRDTLLPDLIAGKVRVNEEKCHVEME